MKEEEIRPIAENYVEEYCHCSDGEYTDGSLVCAGIGTALIVSRQLEKRIEELEEAKANLEYLLEGRDNEIDELKKENKDLAQNLEDTEILNNTYEKRFDNLKKENAELRKIAEFQQSSNMSRHFENKKIKEGLAVGSILNKGLNSLNKALKEERDKYRNMVFDKDKQLTKAKELLNEFMRISKASDEDFEHDYSELIGEAEQFLGEVEK